MNKPKFTPGPWKFEKEHTTWSLVAGKKCLEHKGINEDFVSGNIYDWYLKASAPDLYKALEAALKFIDTIVGADRMGILLAEALAKARGEKL